MQAVMITMEGRRDSAFETAERLAEAGVTTKIFIQPSDWPVGPEGNNRNSRQALLWAIENVTDYGFLFVEDDLVIKPDRFKRAVNAARDIKEVMFFYMHDKPPRMMGYPDEPWVAKLTKHSQYAHSQRGVTLDDLVIPEGPRLMKSDAMMYGAQCFYIPKGHARFLHAFMDRAVTYSANVSSSRMMAIDTSFNKWRMDARIPVYCYVPHPVQHLQNRTLRVGERKDVYSLSFNVKSDLEASNGGV
jgi:hypothetical protein